VKLFCALRQIYRHARGCCVICGKPRSDVYCSITCILKDDEVMLSERNFIRDLYRETKT